MARKVRIDPDIVAFIEAQPRELPYSRLAQLILQQFGPTRAVDETKLREWWCTHHRAFARSRIGRDRDVQAFILDLAGRVSGKQIADKLAESFAADRLPSRTGLYRFLSDLRADRRGRNV